MIYYINRTNQGSSHKLPNKKEFKMEIPMNINMNTPFYMKIEHSAIEDLSKKFLGIEQNKMNDNTSRMGHSFKDEGLLNGNGVDLKKQIKMDSNFSRPLMPQNHFHNISEIHDIVEDSEVRSLNE